MNREAISRAISGISDRHIAEAARYAPPDAHSGPERMKPMKFRTKNLVILAAALALALAFAVTAYAAGWFSPIFHRMQTMWVVPDAGNASPELSAELDEYRAEVQERIGRYAAAEQYVVDQQQQPETVTLPEFDNSSVTLSERYYDGEALLLGLNLDEVTPGIVIGYAPDAALLEKITNVAFFYDVTGNDDLDDLLEQGMDRAIYDDYLANRSDYAKEYDLRNLSAIEFDWFLQRNLEPAEYEEAWRLLRQNGSICIVDSSVYIGDHIRLDDGTDLGPDGRFYLDDGHDARDFHSGGDIFIELDELPDDARNRDVLNIRLQLKNGRTYYYMELGGPALYYYEAAGESLVPFSVENSTK